MTHSDDLSSGNCVDGGCGVRVTTQPFLRQRRNMTLPVLVDDAMVDTTTVVLVVISGSEMVGSCIYVCTYMNASAVNSLVKTLAPVSPTRFKT